VWAALVFPATSLADHITTSATVDARLKRELVRCGPGSDSARVDRRDRVRGCERVSRPG
jgi:hypothetical protein